MYFKVNKDNIFPSRFVYNPLRFRIEMNYHSKFSYNFCGSVFRSLKVNTQRNFKRYHFISHLVMEYDIVFFPCTIDIFVHLSEF